MADAMTTTPTKLERLCEFLESKRDDAPAVYLPWNSDSVGGESMESAPWSSVVDEVIVDIEDGSSWAYGYQIAPIIEGQNEIKVVA